MLNRTLPKTPLQIFCKSIFISKVIVISLIDPDDKFKRNSTLMLLVTNLSNTNWCKIPEKWLKSWHMGVARAIQWIPTWQGLDGFQKSLSPFYFYLFIFFGGGGGESSLSIGRFTHEWVKEISGHERANARRRVVRHKSDILKQCNCALSS